MPVTLWTEVPLRFSHILVGNRYSASRPAFVNLETDAGRDTRHITIEGAWEVFVCNITRSGIFKQRWPKLLMYSPTAQLMDIVSDFVCGCPLLYPGLRMRSRRLN